PPILCGTPVPPSRPFPRIMKFPSRSPHPSPFFTASASAILPSLPTAIPSLSSSLASATSSFSLFPADSSSPLHCALCVSSSLSLLHILFFFPSNNKTPPQHRRR